MFGISRRDIVNDDADAFSKKSRWFSGSMSAIKLDKAVYTLLLSNPSSFFASGNSNLLTGAGVRSGVR